MTKDAFHDRLGSVVECACNNICKFKDQYKDPDDLWDKHCHSCILFEMAETLSDEILEDEDGVI